MKELVIIGLVLCAYFLPTIIGYNCRKASGIFFLNLFLGWTFLGWVGAFIWAVSGEKE
mgnify:CR=1 FL=1